MREKTGEKAEYRSAIRSRRMIQEAYTQLLNLNCQVKCNTAQMRWYDEQ